MVLCLVLCSIKASISSRLQNEGYKEHQRRPLMSGLGCFERYIDVAQSIWRHVHFGIRRDSPGPSSAQDDDFIAESNIRFEFKGQSALTMQLEGRELTLMNIVLRTEPSVHQNQVKQRPTRLHHHAPESSMYYGNLRRVWWDLYSRQVKPCHVRGVGLHALRPTEPFQDTRNM